MPPSLPVVLSMLKSNYIGMIEDSLIGELGVIALGGEGALRLLKILFLMIGGTPTPLIFAPTGELKG